MLLEGLVCIFVFHPQKKRGSLGLPPLPRYTLEFQMLSRIDTLSYTFPLTYFMDQILEQRRMALRSLYESVEVLPASQEYRTVLAKESGGWTSYSELVETLPHYFADSLDAVLVWSVESLLNDVLGLNVEVEQRLKNGRNNFRNSVNFDGGFVAFGGNNRVLSSEGHMVEIPERMQIYFGGEICEKMSEKQWADLYEWSLTVDDLKITRADICVDDYEGLNNLESALDMYHQGLFSGNGRPPKCKYIQNIGENLDGETVYVGSRQSGKMLRVYEKGMQLGDCLSTWVRWEVELTSKSRVIPLDILINSSEYFSGSYSACAQVLKSLEYQEIEPLTIKTSNSKTAIIYQHLLNHGRRAYGRLVAFMQYELGMVPDEIVSTLVDPDSKYPSRLNYMEGQGFDGKINVVHV